MDDILNLSKEARRAQVNREELVERIAGAIREDGRVEPIKGLSLYRTSAPTELAHGMTNMAVCVVAQGSKEVMLGDHRYRYDPAHYLLTTVELPVVGQVVEASPEKPYLSLRLALEPTLIGSVMVEAGHLAQNQAKAGYSHRHKAGYSHRHKAGYSHRHDVRAISVSPLDADLLDAVLRLVRLLDTPSVRYAQDRPFLAPLIVREIIYRLLLGEQADRLRQAVQGSHSHRIARALERLRKEFNQPLRIEEIAQELGMSVSAFHHRFKAVTAMSPLQFQKRLRLQEARRLMLGEHLDAASAGYRVGYDDASHFNREYKRLFGLPPLRDVARLRQAARHNGGLAVADNRPA